MVYAREAEDVVYGMLVIENTFIQLGTVMGRLEWHPPGSICFKRARTKGIAAPEAMHAMAASLSSSVSNIEEIDGKSCFLVSLP